MSQAVQWGMQPAGPASPSAVAGRVNASLDALLSMHKGPAEPSYKVAGTEWLDDSVPTAWLVKQYDGADWITRYKINPTTNALTVYANLIETGQGADIASAATTDIGAAAGNYVKITGTTTITSLGSAGAGVWRTVVFTAALTLTHNATSLILPGGVNITTAAGDAAKFISEGSGKWRCASYQRAASFVEIPEQSAPSTPNAGRGRFYVNTSGEAVFLNDDGVSTVLSGLHGQCRLTKSGANLRLDRFNGKYIIINGSIETIPAAGLTLPATGLSANATYYIYAFMNAGVMDLEAAFTAPGIDSATGVMIRGANTTRTLVGMARTIAGPAWQDIADQRFVRSWFNDPGIGGRAVFSVNRSTTSTSATEINTEIRNEVLLWDGEIWSLMATGSVFHSTAAASVSTAIAIDSTTAATENQAISVAAASAPLPLAIAAVQSGLSEGYHFATLLGSVVAGTGTWRSDITLTSSVRT